MDEKRPKVGVGVMIVKNNKVLLQRRKNAHGEGTWCFPRGHLEFNESWEKCAEREVLEETGLKIKNLKFAGVTNDIFNEEEKHYVKILENHALQCVENLEHPKVQNKPRTSVRGETQGLFDITIFMKADYHSGKEKIIEKDKCDNIGWFDWDSLPNPLFIPVQNLIKQGFNLQNA